MSGSKIRIDLDTATREELVAEVVRLDGTCQRWSEGWDSIVEANREAWWDQVLALWRAAAALGTIINTMPNFPVAEHLEFSEALVNGALAHAQLPTMFRKPAPDPPQ
jgi:hypothetical protein